MKRRNSTKPSRRSTSSRSDRRRRRPAAASIVAFLTVFAGGLLSAQAPEPQSDQRRSQLQEEIDTLLAAPALERASWGIVARSLANNETLCALNGRKLLTPASNMKVVTLAAAAERLGWDFSYETRLVASGPIAGGVLDGDLIVVGSGDPSIDDWDGAASRLFQSWADQLKALGIRTINGRLIGDDNSFDDEALGGGWAWDDLGSSFATGVGALQFNENTAQLGVAPGARVGTPALVTVLPRGTSLAVRNVLTTSAADVPMSVLIRRVPGSMALEIRGSVPLGSGRVVRNVSVDNPTLYFLGALRAKLMAAGIDVRGPGVDIDDLPNALPGEHRTLLLTHRSAPLAELAQTMMRFSQNLYAETLLKTLGSADGPGTADAGRRVIAATLLGWGIGPTDLVIEDGSGLSRYNLATPEAFVAILGHVARDDRLQGPFVATLPIVGRDGTLAQRMKGTPAEGNARAKSGSFSNARALSGYLRTADGEPIVFSIIANNFGVPADIVDSTMDAIIVHLAAFRR